MSLRSTIRVVALLLAATLAGCGKSNQVSIAVIPKGSTHAFWQAVKAGAEAAGSEYHVEILWKGPLTENDRDQQESVVDGFVARGVSGIVLAPLDEQALLAPVQRADAKGIPVVIMDSRLNGKAGADFVSFVATDNHAGGELAGEAMVKALGPGHKKIVLLRYMVGSASTEERERGFLDVIAQHKNYELISDNQYAGGTLQDAQAKSENMLNKLRETDGVFCPNESSTQGMLHVLESSGLAGKVKFIGFDATPDLVKALKAGELDALVAQDPFQMGYTCVKTMVQHLHGEKVEADIPLPAHAITRDNLNDPAIQKLLSH